MEYADKQMTLDEAIKHAEEKGKSCDACAAEHRQLATWLKELREYKKKPRIN